MDFSVVRTVASRFEEISEEIPGGVNANGVDNCGSARVASSFRALEDRLDSLARIMDSVANGFAAATDASADDFEADEKCHAETLNALVGQLQQPPQELFVRQDSLPSMFGTGGLGVLMRPPGG